MKNSVLNKLSVIKKGSSLALQNEALIKEYIEKSLFGEKITLYDFECPPRFLDKDKKGKQFINYLVDLNKVFNLDKIDTYTEIPRVIENKSREKRALQLLNGLGLNINFYKIIADGNLDHITPESLNFIDENKVRANFRKFKKKIELICSKYPNKVHVVLFTELIKNFTKEYERAYNEALILLKENKLVSKRIWQEQLQRIEEHVGIVDKKMRDEFTTKTIASYAAEGIVFDLLSKTDEFKNCIWLNMAEANQRTIEITNCLRKKKGLGPLPMIFF